MAAPYKVGDVLVRRSAGSGDWNVWDTNRRNHVIDVISSGEVCLVLAAESTTNAGFFDLIVTTPRGKVGIFLLASRTINFDVVVG